MEMLRRLARADARGEGPPSVREVGEAVGLRSSQTAYKHLKKLEEAGYIEREGGRARGIRLTEKGWEATGEMPLLGMIAAHIADGDLLVVEEDEDPPDGAVVAALIGGGEEVTVKRLYREGDLLRLRPENGDHEDLVVPAEDVSIQGRVVYVVHPPRGRI